MWSMLKMSASRYLNRHLTKLMAAYFK